MDHSKSINRRRLLNNTLLLYLRMLLILIIGLYTSRIVLKVLGVNDYGIYQVVGGFVSMLGYLNTCFVNSTQRFMSYALGTQDSNNLKQVFSTSLVTNYFVAFCVFILAETFGLWYINNHLVVDPLRIKAVNWVFQFSVLSLIVTIISVPYNSSIIAHEHMHVYAYVSVLEVCLKLVLLFLLKSSPFDKLISYAFLMLLVSIIIRIIYTLYCKKNFEECNTKVKICPKELKEMTSYTGWVALGSLGFSFKDQFSNMIMNLFYGTSINAARGLAIQVNSMVTSFSQNFIMALNPQITKTYAKGDILESKKMVYTGAKLSFYLMNILTIPLIINIDYVLKLWLGIVPEYTSLFIVITLMISSLYVLTNTLTTAINATGEIKAFQIGISIIMLAELPLAYIFLRLGYPPHYALMPGILTTFLAIIFRIIILKTKVEEYNIKEFLMKVVFKCIFIYTLSFIISRCLSFFNVHNIYTFLLSCILCLVSTGLIIYFVGCTSSEKLMIKGLMSSLLHKLCKPINRA